MKILVLTLFPNMFVGPFDQSIVKRAIGQNKVSIEFINIRDFAVDDHKSVDDRPYGGGRGMILRVDVVERALESAKSQMIHDKCRTILLDPQGKTFHQKKAVELATHDALIFLCGHYEGVDERIRTLVDEEISIGDYVLTGGELAAAVVIDSIVRLLPGVLPGEIVTSEESFSLADDGHRILEYPHYTRPEEYKGHHVPEVLLGGNHKEITTWRISEAKKRTQLKRPDLLTVKTDQI